MTAQGDGQPNIPPQPERERTHGLRHCRAENRASRRCVVRRWFGLWPKRPIPPPATRVHGISDWDVRDAPSWPEVPEQVAAALRGRALVIYNAAYDLRMLVQTAQLHGSPRPPAETAFCAMKLYAAWYGEWNDLRGNYRWQRLGEAARQMELVVPEDLHSAATDAGLTRRLVEAAAGV